MSQTATARGATTLKGGGAWAVRAFEGAVIVPALGLLAGQLAADRGEALRGNVADLMFWALVIAAVEFLPVPAWRSLQVSVALPLFMSVAFIFEPYVAGIIAFVGSSDPREFRREVRPLRAIFNRAQASLAVFAASAVFHGFQGDPSAWIGVVPAMLAVVVDYIVNGTLVSVAVGLTYGVPFREVLKKLRIGNPLEFAVSYIGLGFLGVLLARLFIEVGWWAVAAFVMPLLLARQMFFRTRALEDASRELRDRAVVLRALSNRMAEERHDERMQIAGYLHDDMAQLLFRMSLHIDMLNRQIQSGDSVSAVEELESIRVAKDRTAKMLRDLIKDLRLSPLGRAGLVEALETFSDDIERDWQATVIRELEPVEMPPPVQLLTYQIAREAVLNAVKHGGAKTVTIRLSPSGQGATIQIEDDGEGFDVDQAPPEGHFGLTMMRERAQVAGGTFTLTSAPGQGTTVTVEFPTWISESPDAETV